MARFASRPISYSTASRSAGQDGTGPNRDKLTPEQRETAAYRKRWIGTAEGCVVRYRGEVMASLWGIFGADENGYRRVVEAELISEVMHTAGAIGVDFRGE